MPHYKSIDATTLPGTHNVNPTYQKSLPTIPFDSFVKRDGHGTTFGSDKSLGHCQHRERNRLRKRTRTFAQGPLSDVLYIARESTGTCGRDSVNMDSRKGSSDFTLAYGPFVSPRRAFVEQEVHIVVVALNDM